MEIFDKENWRVSMKVIPEDHPPFKRIFHRKCKICDREFIAGGNGDWYGFCHLEFRCDICKKWTSFPMYKMYALDMNKSYGCHKHARSIGAMKKQGPGECCKCGQNMNHRDQFTFGIECGCHAKMYEKHNKSTKMRKIASENGKTFGPKNLINWNKSDAGRAKSSETIKRINALGLNTFVGSETQRQHLLSINHCTLFKENGEL